MFPLQDLIHVLQAQGSVEDRAKQLVYAIQNPKGDVHPHIVAWRAIKRWFMKPITNGLTQKMFKRAHHNESIMKKLLPSWLQIQTGTMAIEWNMCHIIDTGILENVQNPFICGSPDGIGRLHASSPVNEDCELTSPTGTRCALECKTMSTAHTTQEQEMLLGHGLEIVKYIDVMNGQDDEWSITDAHPDFYLYVRSVDHRDQCLYHCVCLNAMYTVYVIGKPGAIVRVVILYFGRLVTKWYSDVIKYQHQTYLSCVASVEAVPEEWDDMDFGWGGDGASVKKAYCPQKGITRNACKTWPAAEP
jgi:hypothetical protein